MLSRYCMALCWPRASFDYVSLPGLASDESCLRLPPKFGLGRVVTEIQGDELIGPKLAREITQMWISLTYLIMLDQGLKSYFALKSATKPFNLLLACICPLVTEFADN